MTDPSREATAELVARGVGTGLDDPAIATRLGITVSEVRSLRAEFNIRDHEPEPAP